MIKRMFGIGMMAATGAGFWILYVTAFAPQGRSAVRLGQPLEGRANPEQTFIFRLGEGSAGAPPLADPIPIAEGQPMSAEETAAALERLPPFDEDAQPAEFAQRDASLPAPRPGETVEVPFPPPAPRDRDADADNGPLAVLRVAPEGDVAAAANVSVTFNQPMIPLASLEDIALERAPVILEPQPEDGRWRWLGTKTLVFERETRLPMATRYQVTVPAEASSVAGSRLGASRSWTFTTPPPRAVAFHPAAGVSQPRDPVMYMAFDQDIDPAAVAAHLRVRADGGAIGTRLAEPAEIEAAPAVAAMAERYGPKRGVAFKAVAALPYDAETIVEAPPGLPSAEGPLRSQQAQAYRFRTYGPLKVVETRCGWRDRCPPMQPWTIQFNNALDQEAFREDWVRVEPVIEGMRVFANFNTLHIQGLTRGGQTYKVALNAEIRDQYEQTLGREQELSFTVGEADPNFFGFNDNYLTLDPYAPPSLTVYTVNFRALRISVHRVTPDDWPAFEKALQDFYRGRNVSLPGTSILDETRPVTHQKDALVETSIDLAAGLDNGYGQLVVAVKPVQPSGPIERPRYAQRGAMAWIQRTDIGVTAFEDDDRLLVWTADLKDGRPLANARATLTAEGGGSATAVSDTEGMASLPLTAKRSNALTVRLGDDLAFLPGSRAGARWQSRRREDRAAWFVFDDRGVYRPGETVRVKGWARKIERGKRGGVALVGAGQTGRYTVYDARNNRLKQGELTLTGLGGFDLAFSTPDNANTGSARVEIEIPELGSANHAFQIQEYRRPEYEVTVRTEPGPYFVGDSAVATAEAAYYAGGPLPASPTRWTVSAFEASFTPPNLSDYTFGVWRPWWDVPPFFGPLATRSFEGATDAGGKHRLRLDFDRAEPATPKRLRVEAAVRDRNNQSWGDGVDLLVHPGAYYVGLRSERIFVNKDTPFAFEAVVADLDGKLVENVAVEVRVSRMESKFRQGRWREEARDLQTFSLRSGADPVPFAFQTPKGGVYRIEAEVRDGAGRRNQTRVTRWVAGPESRPSSDRVERETVTLIPDQSEYRPGDTAEILVRAPFAPAEGVMTLRRDGIVESERFSITGDGATLRVPIEAWHTPNLHLRVDLVGAAPRLDESGADSGLLPLRPAFAAGSLDLSIPPRQKTLTVVAEPERRELAPGEETEIAITVRGPDGAPAAGVETAVIVVDEAVLALTGYRLGDPLAAFYPRRDAGGGVLDLRRHVLLAKPGDLLEGGAAVVQEFAGAEDAMPAAPALSLRPSMARESVKVAADGGASPAVAVRLDFNPLAAFIPAARADAQGRVAVTVKLPDNLTRYRIMAVAAEADRFGVGESSITARLPLMLRPSPPRFLNFGDRFQLALTVQNQTDEPLEVHVAARAQNLAFTEGRGRKITAPPRDRVRVLLPAAAMAPGTARFQAVATAGDFADAAELELPVWTPATAEAFAVYGELDQGAILQPVLPPEDVYPQFGGLEITASSTALQALTDAFIYIANYRFSCSEQLASRILAIAALGEILAEFGAGVDPATLEQTIARDLDRLAQLQNADGGYGFWRRGEASWPFLTIHTAHAMARAKEAGRQPPAHVVNRLMAYLRSIDRHLRGRNYSERNRYTLRAYALWTLRLMGETDRGKARAVLDALPLDEAPLEGLGWLLPLLDAGDQARVVRHLLNRVSETAAAANFTTRYQEGAYLTLQSDRRADGVILDSLIDIDPGSDLIPKLARGLMAHRVKGRWANTQENVFILLALRRYFQTYERQTPDFTARVWLGDRYAGEQRFRGRTADYRQIDVPMAWLNENRDAADLLLAKQGEGRLYYRLGLRYAPQKLDLSPESQGFYVERRYEAVDRPGDVVRGEDGVWRVKAGARVRVRISMVAPNRRYHVALVDPLPAGLEPLNPALATTEALPYDPNQPAPYLRWRLGRWHQHENLRDERAEAFTTLLRAGVHEYRYTARATTPGEFIVPPAKAEEMYHPETFGRSGTDRLVVIEAENP